MATITTTTQHPVPPCLLYQLLVRDTKKYGMVYEEGC